MPLSQHSTIDPHELAEKPSATGITGSRRAAFSELMSQTDKLAARITERVMARRQPVSRLTWADVKAQLASFDRMGLIGLIQDLYAAHEDNRTFLHARLGLGEDVLKPYKETLDRWLWPDVLRKQDTCVAKAKQAISSYRKAVGEPRCGRSAIGAISDLLTVRCSS